MIARKRLVQSAHQLGGTRVVATDDDAIGLHEVLDRSAFLEEFGVRDDNELEGGAPAGERLGDLRPDLVRRTDRNGRFGDDDAIPVEVRRDGPRRAEHVTQISRSVLIRRRTNGDQLEQTVLDTPYGI